MEKLLTPSDVASMIGINKKVLYQWTYKNKIPHLKLSKRMIRFKESELNEWLEKKHCVRQSGKKNLTSIAANKKSREKISSIKNDCVAKIVEIAKKQMLVDKA